MSERDTHFHGAAQLLWERLNSYGLTNIADNRLLVSERDRINREIEQTTQEVIAQFAYDLAMHVLANQPIIPRNTFPDDSEVIGKIPDLTQWPEQT